MKRNIAMLMAGLFLILTVIGFLAWINNISIAREWYNDLKKGELYQITTKSENENNGGNLTSGSKIYSGPIPIFDEVSKVDTSTVATFVPFFGCLLIVVGFYRIATAKKGSHASEYFPFFKSYISVIVALGLIGTVWGLIMIGYYPANRIQMSDLVLCLHTALYSTFVSLIWAFLIVLPIRYVMQTWYVCVSEPLGTTGTITAAIEEISSAITQTSDVVNKANSEFGELSDKLPGIKTSFDGIASVLGNLKNRLEGMLGEHKKLLVQMNSESQTRQKAAEEQQKVIMKLSAEYDKEKPQREKAEKERDDAKAKAAQAESENKALNERAQKAEKERDTAKTQVKKMKEKANELVNVSDLD